MQLRRHQTLAIAALEQDDVQSANSFDATQDPGKGDGSPDDDELDEDDEES